MIDTDVTILFWCAAAGGFGGAAYSYYNKLFTVSTYLQGLEHVAAGAIVGVLAILGALGSGYSVPTSIVTAVPFIVAGYAGTDILDTLFQRYASSIQSTSTNAPTPPK